MVTAKGVRERRPPAVLGLVGHPLRWRLLRELGQSDRQVRQLSARLGESQSLVSYHLGRLHAGELVSVRRSSADRRDVYYALDLARCGQLMAAAGAALHPGLELVPSWEAGGAVHPATSVKVLFLCTGNGARSQIAQALLEELTGGVAKAFSAGSHPKSLHPNAVRTMAERGVDIAGRTTTHLDRYARRRFDYVITLCDRVREVCPEFPGVAEPIHWSIPDPAADGSSDEESYPRFQQLAVELDVRIRFFLQLVEHPPTTDATSS